MKKVEDRALSTQKRKSRKRKGKTSRQAGKKEIQRFKGTAADLGCPPSGQNERYHQARGKGASYVGQLRDSLEREEGGLKNVGEGKEHF